jgi:hypothetical protein
MAVRHNISHKSLSAAKDTEDYLEDLDKHLGITLGKAKYIGLTLGRAFARTLNRIQRAYWAINELKPGPKPKVISEWAIVRQPHDTKLDQKKQQQLDDAFIAALGPGAIAKFVTHTPTIEKVSGEGIPGPEQNALASACKKIGPYIIRLRSSTRNLRRELMRAMDQLVRQWNQAEKDQEKKIPEVPDVRAAKIKKDHRLLHEVLADIEENLWLKQHPEPKDVSVFEHPVLNATRNRETAQAALRRRGFDVEQETDREEFPSASRRKHKKAPVPKAKIGFWRVTSAAWEAKRIMMTKRNKPDQAEPACLIDSLRILCEARTLFRARLKEREKEWIKEQERIRTAEERQEKETVPVLTQRSPQHRLPPLVAPELIVAAEKNQQPLLKNAAEASRLFTMLEYPVRRDQPSPDMLELGAGTRTLTQPRNELLIAMQLAKLRGLILRCGRRMVAEFYFVHSQATDFTAANARFGPRDPFDPCWQEAYARLQNPMHQEDWYDALDAVAAETKNRGPLRATQKAARFYRYLRVNKGMPSQVALLLACMHFRSSAVPFTALIASLQTDIQALGLPRAVQPGPAKAETRETAITALPQFPPLPKTPPPAPAWEEQHKPEQEPKRDTPTKLAPPTTTPKNKPNVVDQQKPKAPVPATAHHQASTPAPSPEEKPSPPEEDKSWQRKPEAPMEMPPTFILSELTSHLTQQDSPPVHDEDVDGIVNRCGFSIVSADGEIGTVAIVSDYFKAVVHRSALKLALWLAVIDQALPKESRASGPHRIRFEGQHEFTVSKQTCESLLQMLDAQWLHIMEVLEKPRVREIWTRAYRSSLTEHGILRAAAIHGQLTEAGIDANVATALVLSQLRGELGYTEKLFDRIDPVRRILQRVTIADARTETMAATATICQRAGVTISPAPGEEFGEVILRFKRHEVAINRSELMLYIEMAALAASLPRRPRDNDNALGLEFWQVDDVSPEDRGFLSRRWLARLDDHREKLLAAMAEPSLRHAWTMTLESTAKMEPDSRAAMVFCKMAEHGLTTDEALLLLASQVGPQLATMDSLLGKLPIRQIE